MAMNPWAGHLGALADRLEWLDAPHGMLTHLRTLVRDAWTDVLAVRPDADGLTLEGHHAYSQWHRRFEWETIYDGLGTLFVTAQRELVRWHGTLRRLDVLLRREGHAHLPFETTKAALYARTPELGLVNAVANYFKHEAEWSGGWSFAPTQPTQRIVAHYGALSYISSRGNMQILASSAGVTCPETTAAIEGYLRAWGSAIVNETESHLLALNLVESRWRGRREWVKSVRANT